MPRARGSLPLRPTGRLVAGAAVVVAVALLPTLLPSYWLFLATSAVISAIVARSVGVVTGRAGMISLAQLAFAGIGGYIVVWLATHAPDVPLVLQLLGGALVAAAVGACVGLPALRLRGISLAVVTLGVATTVATLLTIHDFPGTETFVTVARPAGFRGDETFYVFCFGCFVFLGLLLAWADRSRLGRSWLVVRRSERAAASAGLSVARTKLSAFAVSAAIAGVAGGLLASQQGILTVDYFLPLGSLVVFATAVLAGAHRPEGAALAGILAVFVPEVLRRLDLPQDLGNAIFAVGVIATLAGGASVADAVRRRFAERHVAAIPRSERAPTEAPGPRATIASVNGRRKAGTVLELKTLSVRYGEVVALSGVDMRLRSGTIAALIGPNGAGKSTLVDAVSGYVRPSGGTIELGGRPIDRLPPHRRAQAGIRRTFQQDRTIPELTIGGYVRLAAHRRLDDSELAEVLSFFDCPDARLPLGVVDVGSRRLVELAGAAAAHPQVLLLDEPGAGLTPEESLELAARIAAIPAWLGCAVLLIEHDMEMVRVACREVTVLDFGSLVASGPTRDVLERRDVVAAYLGHEVGA